MLDPKKKLAFVAGRSGGHLLPALTLARQTNADVLFFSTNTALDKKILDTYPHIHYQALGLNNVPRKIYKLPLFALQLMRSFFTCLYQLYTHKPSKVISTGGYIAIPVCIAAKVLRIPIELYELNVVPGKATKFLSPLANTTYTCFEQTKQHLPKSIPGEYPLRFTEDDKNDDRGEILQRLGLSQDKQTILVLGGSQGSVFINNQIKQLLAHNNLGNHIQIIHQTGTNDSTDWPALYQQHNIGAIVFDYTSEIKDYYIAADLIICRSGAGTLFEVAFFQIPCITIPLEIATTTHQVDNARAMAQQYPQLFSVLQQHELENNPSILETYLLKQT